MLSTLSMSTTTIDCSFLTMKRLTIWLFEKCLYLQIKCGYTMATNIKLKMILYYFLSGIYEL